MSSCIIVTFMRSGTHLTMDLLRKQFAIGGYKRPGEALDALYTPLDIFIQNNENKKKLVRRQLQNTTFPVFKSHYLEPTLLSLRNAEPEICVQVEAGHWFYIVRRPDKVMASMWEFEKSYRHNDDPEKWLMDISQRWVKHVNDWLKYPNIHVFRFEDLINDTEACLNRFETIEEAIEAIHLQIYYYNNHRIHTALKMSPVEFAKKKK